MEISEKIFAGSDLEAKLMARCYQMYHDIDILIQKQVYIVGTIEETIIAKSKLPNPTLRNKSELCELENNKKNAEDKLEKTLAYLMKLVRLHNEFLSKRLEDCLRMLTDHAPRNERMIIIHGIDGFYGIDRNHLVLILKSGEVLQLIENARTNTGLLREPEKTEALINQFYEYQNKA